ncbi:MAG: hypothetical protein FWH38_01400 [Treponema sp.]|nr:hypothetical protein [Treponema sp.]
MKRTIFGFVTVLLAFGLILAGCAGPADPLADLSRAAKSDEIRLDPEQLALAKDVFPFESDRDNASGPKIPSNAHSDDFPGVYFYWADKQKAEECFLLVETAKFDEYKGFVLTKKVSDTYWDYAIGKASEDNIVTANGKEWYLYKIPSGKAYYEWEEGEDGDSVAVLKDQQPKQNGNGSFNINMVFISEWEEIDKPYSQMMDDPVYSEKFILSFTKEVYKANGDFVAVEDWEESDVFTFDLIDVVSGEIIDTKTLTKDSEGAPVVTFEVDKNGSYQIKERLVDGYEEADIISVVPTLQKKTIEIISKANNNADFGTFVVDAKGKWNGGTYRKPLHLYDPNIKAYWNAGVRASNPAAFDDMMKYGPTWIWDRSDSWKWGTTGSEIIHYQTTFDLSADDYAGIVMRDGVSDVENYKYAVPIYFACDNVAILFVNEQIVAWTEKALKGRDVPGYGETFRDLSDDAFDGNAWQQIYFADIYNYLQVGSNKVEFYAANSEYVEGETQNNDYKITNNPCGIIFASVINIEKDLGDGIDKVLVNNRLPKDLPTNPAARGSGWAGWVTDDVDFRHPSDDVKDGVYRLESGWEMAFDPSISPVVDMVASQNNAVGTVTVIDNGDSTVTVKIDFNTEEYTLYTVQAVQIDIKNLLKDSVKNKRDGIQTSPGQMMLNNNSPIIINGIYEAILPWDAVGSYYVAVHVKF